MGVSGGLPRAYALEQRTLELPALSPPFEFSPSVFSLVQLCPIVTFFPTISEFPHKSDEESFAFNFHRASQSLHEKLHCNTSSQSQYQVQGGFFLDAILVRVFKTFINFVETLSKLFEVMILLKLKNIETVL